MECENKAGVLVFKYTDVYVHRYVYVHWYVHVHGYVCSGRVETYVWVGICSVYLRVYVHHVTHTLWEWWALLPWSLRLSVTAILSREPGHRGQDVLQAPERSLRDSSQGRNKEMGRHADSLQVLESLSVVTV